MEFKGTQGDWECTGTVVDHLGNWAVTETTSGRRCAVAFMSDDGITDDEMEANARLIAAAPDLLAALEELVDWQNGPPLLGPKWEPGWNNAMSMVRAAIAKALGESQ